MAHTSCMLDNQRYMHTHLCARACACSPARTHTHKYIIFIDCSRQQRFANASVLLYTYIVNVGENLRLKVRCNIPVGIGTRYTEILFHRLPLHEVPWPEYACTSQCISENKFGEMPHIMYSAC
jgi:hypothetical protein